MVTRKHLNVVSWRDEDGPHTSLILGNPRKFFCWPGYRACNVKYAMFGVESLEKVLSAFKVLKPSAYKTDNLALELLKCEEGNIVHVDIEDWDLWFDWIKPQMRYL